MASCSLHTEFSSLGITTQTKPFISPFQGFSPVSFQDLKKKKSIGCISSSQAKWWAFLVCSEL